MSTKVTITYDSTAAVLDLYNWTPTTTSASKIIVSQDTTWNTTYYMEIIAKHALVFDGQGNTLSLGTTSNWIGLIDDKSSDSWVSQYPAPSIASGGPGVTKGESYGLIVKNLIFDCTSCSLNFSSGGSYLFRSNYGAHGFPSAFDILGAHPDQTTDHPHVKRGPGESNINNFSIAQTDTTNRIVFTCQIIKVNIKCMLDQNGRGPTAGWKRRSVASSGGERCGSFFGIGPYGRFLLKDCKSDRPFTSYSPTGYWEILNCFLTDTSSYAVMLSDNVNRHYEDWGWNNDAYNSGGDPNGKRVGLNRYIFKNCVWIHTSTWSGTTYQYYGTGSTASGAQGYSNNTAEKVSTKPNHFTAFDTIEPYTIGDENNTKTTDTTTQLSILGSGWELVSGEVEIQIGPKIHSITHDCDMVKGSIQRIHFSTTEETNNVKIELVNGSNSLTLAASHSITNGFFDWTIPTDLSMNPSTPIAGNCFIKITDTVQSSVSLTSSIPITIYKAFGGSDAYTAVSSAVALTTNSGDYAGGSMNGYCASDTLCNGNQIIVFYESTDDKILKGKIGINGTVFTIKDYVNGNASNNLGAFEVVALKQGGFVVAWRKDSIIRAKWYNDDGTAVGNSFEITTTLASTFGVRTGGPTRLAATHDGGFILSYHYHSSAPALGYFVKYNKNQTTANISETRIFTAQGNVTERNPTCCVLKNGNYLFCAATKYSIFNSKTKTWISQNNPFTIFSSFPVEQYPPTQTLKVLEDGNILVIFEKNNGEVCFGITKQTTDSSTTLTIVKDTTIVNTTAITSSWTVREHESTTVINGGFIIAWYNTTNKKSYYRMYNNSGTPLTNETIIINTENTKQPGFFPYKGRYGYLMTYTDFDNTTIYIQPYTFVNVFIKTTISETSVLHGVDNTLTFTIASARQIASGETITIRGLTGSQTVDNASLTITGANSSLFGSSGSWTQSTGTLVLTLDSNMTASTDYTFTITLQNKDVSQTAVTPTIEISGTNSISASSMSSGVLSSTTAPTFTKYDIHESTIVQGQTNKIKVVVRPQIALSAGQEIRITGLTGTTTADNSTMGITGEGANLFTGSQGSWTQSTGTFVVTVANGKTVPTDSDTEFIFEVINPGSANGEGNAVDISGTGLGVKTSLFNLISAQMASDDADKDNYFLWFNYGGMVTGPYTGEYAPKGTEGIVEGTDFGKNYARAKNYYVMKLRGTSWNNIYTGGTNWDAIPSGAQKLVIGEVKYNTIAFQNLDTLGCFSGYDGYIDTYYKQNLIYGWQSRRIRSDDANANFDGKRGFRLNNDDPARNNDKSFPYGTTYGNTGAVPNSNDTGALSSSTEFAKTYYIENDRRYTSHTGTSLHSTYGNELKYIPGSLMGTDYSGATLTSKNQTLRFKFTLNRHPPVWKETTACDISGCPTPTEEAATASVAADVQTAITSAAVASATVTNDGKLDVTNSGVIAAIAAMKAELSSAVENNSSSSRRKKRTATLKLLFSQNSQVKKIKMKKEDLSLPATFTKPDVVVIRAGETIDVSAFDSAEGGESGFYSVLGDGQKITVTILGKTITVTRTDDGGVEKYYLTNSNNATISDVTTTGSYDPSTNPNGDLKPGDKFTVQNNRILLIGSLGDGGTASSGNNYVITVGSKTGGGNAFYFNGIEAPTIVFTSGNTYTITHPSSHPFRFSETSDGTHNNGTKYGVGVTVINNTTVLFNVTSITPSTLYYYCENHAGMGAIADVQYPASGADPYVHPIRGLTYKLPNKKAYYRLYEKDDVFINGAVKKASNKKIKEINNYFKNSNINGNIISDGYFYSAYFISVGDKKFVMDLKSFKFLTTQNSHDFFKFKINEEYISGTWENGKALVLNVSWKHPIHGIMGLDIVKYENPQIDSMIRLKNYPSIENTVGALIKNYKPKLMQIPKLNSVKAGKIARKLSKAKNKFTKKAYMEKGEKWIINGKSYNQNNI
tara:strand:+ start:33 stop:5879 length:5847 start_codon:yes stop_codon:yes gene_type:complete